MRVVAFLGARCVWKIYFVNYDLVFQHWMISAKLGVVGSLSNIKELFTKGFATKRPTCRGVVRASEAVEEMSSPQRKEAAKQRLLAINCL